MDEEFYRYRVNSIQLKNGESFKLGRINVFVGANNCGKTRMLKDIFSYITGRGESAIIIKDLDINYPKTWDEFEQAYDMNIVKEDHHEMLRHISPMFNGESVGARYNNVSSTLSTQLVSDKPAFRLATGDGMVTYLNTDNRLVLAMKKTVEANLRGRGAKNLLETLYVSGIDSTEKLRECIKSIFNLDIFLNSSNLGTLEIKIGDDFSEVPNNSQEAFKQLDKYQLLDTQGDGIRSVVGIISAIISTKKPVILFDEPEAFLHPPTILQLGKIIEKLVDESQQIFIATHSADLLRGLFSSTRDAVIIRLNRTADDTRVKILDSSTLEQIVTDPLLSSSRVLEGMFYKGVVATEGDADAVFYQRMFQKIGAADEIHFVNAHNKQTLKKIAAPYQKLGIKCAMIADADVIRDKREFTDILQISLNKELKQEIFKERDIILNYFQNQSNYELLKKLQDKTKELIEQTLVTECADPNDIEKKLNKFRADLKDLREESDKLLEFKRKGRTALPTELQPNFDTLWKYCASIGLFIVEVGELESWLIDYRVERTSNKSKWISEALKKLFEIEYNEDKEIWKFINALRDFLVN